MLTHMSPRTNQFQSLRRGSPYVVGSCSVILTIISIYGGIELSVATAAWSEAATAVEMVKTHVLPQDPQKLGANSGGN
jgi:hypothetical protein